MSLSDVVRKMTRGDAAVSSLIDEYLYGRQPDHREDGWHVSDFCKMCARARVLKGLRPQLPAGRNVNTERIWDLGKAIHHIYQNWYLGPAGVLWGKWKCSRCEKVVWGFKPKPSDDLCISDDLSGHLWVYKEVPLRLPVAERLPERMKEYADFDPKNHRDIIGHSDGLVLIPELEMWVDLEIKSCKDAVFRFQISKGAYPAHKAQADIYGTLVRAGYVDAPNDVKVPIPEEKLILYINKDNGSEKEFLSLIDGDYAASQFDKVTEVEESKYTGVLPERQCECPDIRSPIAKKCSEKSGCFSEKTLEELRGGYGG